MVTFKIPNKVTQKSFGAGWGLGLLTNMRGHPSPTPQAFTVVFWFEVNKGLKLFAFAASWIMENSWPFFSGTSWFLFWNKNRKWVANAADSILLPGCPWDVYKAPRFFFYMPAPCLCKQFESPQINISTPFWWTYFAWFPQNKYHTGHWEQSSGQVTLLNPGLSH